MNVKTVAAPILLTLVIASSLFVAHMNGGSLDITDRELLIVVTDSMDGPPQPYDIPSIPRNSLVMVENLAPAMIEELRVGDVVGFRTAVAEGPVFHRIQDINSTTRTMVLRGDQSHFSETVGFEDVISIVRGVDGSLGGIALFVKMNSLFLILLIAMTAALLHLLEIFRKEGSESR